MRLSESKGDRQWGKENVVVVAKTAQRKNSAEISEIQTEKCYLSR